MKKVLVLCTGNSCRSIMAEGLINCHFEDIQAWSSGVNHSGKVNPNAKKILIENNCWRDDYHSKGLDEVLDIDFDLVLTVCDNAKEQCPTFPKKVKTVHLPFPDPDGLKFEEFKTLWKDMKTKIIPTVQELLNK
jgi:arsenate reductase